ncbi:MAG: MBL fold metallo-hydrolase [Clostridia bacterium]|nr:MBL fold metallo-hydrolase [Clostridia bacterium]
MHLRVLMDNIEWNGLIGEWGLSLLIDYAGHSILLDAGATGRFVENARAMGVNLKDVECCVLSHGHYDHADGFERFFEENDHAKVALQRAASQRYYGKKWIFRRYIGVDRDMLRDFRERFHFVDGAQELLSGAHLIPHSTAGLEAIAARGCLYMRSGRRLTPDSFLHEQSLVLEEDGSLVIFNSCSHAGPDNIIREVRDALPDKPIRAYVGGLHLFHLSEDEVCALAERIRQTDVERIVTGHCTGTRAYELLRRELGEGVVQMHSGMELEL